MYDEFSISDEGKYVIYAKITDHAGNETYISSDVLDTAAGETETLEPVKLENGLQVTLNGLSPVAVAWSDDAQEGTNTGVNDGNAGTGTNADRDSINSTKTVKDNNTENVPVTGDSAPFILLLEIMVLCAAAVGFIKYKKIKNDKR